MRDGGRIDAAISILDDVLNRRQPIKTAVRDWGKSARYAGAKDRAWVSGLVLDALRRKQSLSFRMDSVAPRALCLGTLAHVWNWPLARIEEAVADEHGPAELSDDERKKLTATSEIDAADHIRGDYPEWLEASMVRTFGDNAVAECQAMAVRAPVDLRVNTLKADREKVEKALRPVDAIAMPLLNAAFRVPAPDPSQRAGSVESIPAYSKGWVEVQDAGSQIAAAAANPGAGEQVLDYCAGGGGKTLALAAALNGKGQVYAFDIDGRRLSALIPRLKRAGAHNVQMRHPQEDKGLSDLEDMMDLVVIDAPCTGVGTWRRRPDAKWRVSQKALEQRQEQQAEILKAASVYVKPGGRLLYITCSFLMEENEDQVAAFVKEHPQFKPVSTADSAIASGALTGEGVELVKACEGESLAVRLTPLTAGTDGFFMALLKRDA